MDTCLGQVLLSLKNQLLPSLKALSVAVARQQFAVVLIIHYPSQ